MQEKKTTKPECNSKKKKDTKQGKNTENIFHESSSQECLTGEATDFKEFLKKEAYTPEYSPGYAAQEKTDWRIPINYFYTIPY